MRSPRNFGRKISATYNLNMYISYVYRVMDILIGNKEKKNIFVNSNGFGGKKYE